MPADKITFAIDSNPELMEVQAFQISDSIDIKALKNVIREELYYADSDELFYHPAPNQFLGILQYGVVCFLDYDQPKIDAFLLEISPFCKRHFDLSLKEAFIIEPAGQDIVFGYNKISIVSPDIDAIRLIMLNVSQSVALDYYTQQANLLMEETTRHTQFLERKGRMDLTGKKLKKFIGKTLNLKNSIAENLYIFDSPPETWEDEHLSRIDLGMKKTFDLQIRYRNLQQDLQILKENLELFKDIMQHTHSNVLEWIIIFLILIEILDLFFEKIVH